MSRRTLSRRTLLRGAVAGTTIGLGLPFLEATHRTKHAAADPLAAAPFFGLFYWANGLPWHSGHGAEQAGRADLWTPSTTGAGYAPTELLAPLARHNVSVISGLEPHTDVPSTPGGQGDGHMRGFMVALTGDRPQSETFDHGSHTLTALRPSIDQFVARHDGFYSEPPRFRSLEVGVSRARFHDYGHWNAVSYNGTNSLNLPVQDPSALYDRLFAARPDDAQSMRRARLLDAVLEDARDLSGQLGQRDRERLEAHLEHINELQRRIETAAPVCGDPGRPIDSGDLLARTRTMAELLALSVSCGLTRVFSFMLTSPASTHVFSDLGVPDGMHKTCHDGHWDRVRDITVNQMQAFSAFLDAFNIPDGPDGGTLLDRGLVYGTSEYGEGWRHSVKELPVVLAGGACGNLVGGVHERVAGGNISRAQLTALQALGLGVESFGWNGGQTSDPISGVLV